MYTDGWSSDSNKEATSYLKALSEFEFITGRFPLPLIASFGRNNLKIGEKGRTIYIVVAYTQIHLEYGAYERIHRRGISANIQALGEFGSQALYRTVYSENCGEAKIPQQCSSRLSANILPTCPGYPSP